MEFKNIKLNNRESKNLYDYFQYIKQYLEKCSEVLFSFSPHDMGKSRNLYNNENINKNAKFYYFGKNEKMIFLNMMEEMKEIKVIEIGEKPLPIVKQFKGKTATRFILDEKDNKLYNKHGRIILKNVDDLDNLQFNLNNLNGLLVSYCSKCKKMNKSLLPFYQIMPIILTNELLNTSGIFQNAKYLKHVENEFLSDFLDYLRGLWSIVTDKIKEEHLPQIPFLLIKLLLEQTANKNQGEEKLTDDIYNKCKTVSKIVVDTYPELIEKLETTIKNYFPLNPDELLVEINTIFNQSQNTTEKRGIKRLLEY